MSITMIAMPRYNMVKFFKNNSLEPNGENGGPWMNFIIFTERPNLLKGKKKTTWKLD